MTKFLVCAKCGDHLVENIFTNSRAPKELCDRCYKIKSEENIAELEG